MFNRLFSLFYPFFEIRSDLIDGFQAVDQCVSKHTKVGRCRVVLLISHLYERRMHSRACAGAQTHLCTQEPVDIPKHPQQQISPFSSLLIRLFLQCDPLLLSLCKERFDLPESITELSCVFLVSPRRLGSASRPFLPSFKQRQTNL